MFSLLSSILPIPFAPVQNDESVLLNNQEVLGIQFPSDFVEYSCTYGSGRIGNDAYTWDVVSGACPFYPRFVEEFRDTFSSCHEGSDKELTIFPEPGGLLPFGCCENGVWWCWRTVGNCDEWTILDIYDWDEDGCREYSMCFSTFLFKVLRGEIELPGKKLSTDPIKIITFCSVEQ